MNRKADYVRGQGHTRAHSCHWRGCPKQVPPAMWGCRAHWFALPKRLRDKIWRAYRPGQEIVLSPSEEYLAIAREVDEWIADRVKRYADHIPEGACPVCGGSGKIGIDYTNAEELECESCDATGFQGEGKNMRKVDELREGCFAHAADDEPLFVLRANDKLAPTTVEFWAERARVAGVRTEKVESALELASAMRVWQAEHGAKAPD